MRTEKCMQTIEYRYVCSYYDQTNEYYSLCRIHGYLHILRSKVTDTRSIVRLERCLV